jgi:hypothetical protein
VPVLSAVVSWTSTVFCGRPLTSMLGSRPSVSRTDVCPIAGRSISETVEHEAFFGIQSFDWIVF